MDQITCNVCGKGIEDGSVTCTKCSTPNHKECFEYNGRCGVYACGHNEYEKGGKIYVLKVSEQTGLVAVVNDALPASQMKPLERFVMYYELYEKQSSTPFYSSKCAIFGTPSIPSVINDILETYIGEYKHIKRRERTKQIFLYGFWTGILGAGIGMLSGPIHFLIVGVGGCIGGGISGYNHDFKKEEKFQQAKQELDAHYEKLLQDQQWEKWIKENT